MEYVSAFLIACAVVAVRIATSGLTFVVFTVFCPYRSARVAVLAGSAAEVAVSAYGVLVRVAPLLLDRV